MFWNKTITSNQKAVLITGCDSGFGYRLALKLNDMGFQIYATVLDSQGTGARDLRSKCRHENQMSILDMNVVNDRQIDECFEYIQKDLDDKNYKLWALVNNAGIISYGNLEWGQFDEFNKLFDVNVFGVVRVTRKFVPLLRQSKGRIVITASLGGRLAADLLAAYCMTKAAVISFADTLRREMNKFNIKVITIEPGIFKTSMYYIIGSILDRQWLETDASVREVYGDKYFEELIQRYNKSDSSHGIAASAGHDIDKVINDMVKAVVSRYPFRYYRPVQGLLPWLTAKFVSFVPQFLIDWYFESIDGLVPAFMTNTSDLNISNETNVKKVS